MSKQDTVVSRLEARGFKFDFELESGEIALSKKHRGCTLLAQVDYDGTVNGESIEDYLLIMS